VEQRDVVVIGAGPAGAAAAIRLAGGGARVTVFEKGSHGRDKVCGDGLTPRAVGALQDLKVDLEGAHRIDGLRMIAGRRSGSWPGRPPPGSPGRARSGPAAVSTPTSPMPPPPPGPR
jgi:menaquinone-9 beta-reductase